MLSEFADWLVYGALGLDSDSAFGKALAFFIYDSVKISVLLVAVCILMGVVNAFFPVARVRNFLASHHLYGLQYLLAALFGAATPFCSCSSIPLFIGFVRGGIPLGVTFSFLITSPLVNEVAVAMFLGSFGIWITLLYVSTGIILGVAGGWILSLFSLERHLEPWVRQIQKHSAGRHSGSEEVAVPIADLLRSAVADALGILRRVYPYVLAGIGLGAAIHGYLPEGFLAQWLGEDSWFAVPMAVVLAVPMYANAAGVVPVVQVLVEKGVSIGTAIAFMMAVVGLSLPEAVMLKKVMNVRLLAIFFGTVAIFITISGWLFNAVL